MTRGIAAAALAGLAAGLGGCASSRCEVHGDPLEPRDIAIRYGLLDLPGDLRACPHRGWVAGGCEVGDDDLPSRPGWVCATCSEEWQRLDRAGRADLPALRSWEHFEERRPERR